MWLLRNDLFVDQDTNEPDDHRYEPDMM